MKLNDDHVKTILSSYETPTSCFDLAQLGHTLNGFHLVKADPPDNVFDLPIYKIIHCFFNKPEGVGK